MTTEQKSKIQKDYNNIKVFKPNTLVELAEAYGLSIEELLNIITL